MAVRLTMISGACVDFRRSEPSKKWTIFALAVTLLLPYAETRENSFAAEEISTEIPQQFVAIYSFAPAIKFDVRYFTDDNFVGNPIDGYHAAKIFMLRDAAVALLAVQEELTAFGLGLKIFDAYRPQRAVDHFVRWGSDLDDVKMQQQYYPRVDKANLFRDGYIAERSGHSRGATVDLTIVDLLSGVELDMGTPWDFFDALSWPSSNGVSAEQRANRMLLQQVMTRHGFEPLQEEWWHFTLLNEPFPDTYFDFPIE